MRISFDNCAICYVRLIIGVSINDVCTTPDDDRRTSN